MYTEEKKKRNPKHSYYQMFVHKSWWRFASYPTRSLEMTKAHVLGALARTPGTRSFAVEACYSKVLRSAAAGSHFRRNISPLPFAGCIRKLEQQSKARTMSTGSQKHGKNKGPVTWEAVGLLVVVGGGLVVYFNSLEDDRLQRLQVCFLSVNDRRTDDR